MARKVFFSFHYENDIWRVNAIRHHWVTKPNLEEAGYIDKADYEKLEKKGSEAIKRWIDSQLQGTSVTVVLIGAKTSERDWVIYEIEKSLEKGNGLLGIYIHQVKDQNQNTANKGENPFNIIINIEGKRDNLASYVSQYDWVDDKGYDNFSKWVENAAKKAGR